MIRQTPQPGMQGDMPDTDPPMPQYRGLKTAVITMGVLLVAGFIVVFSTIIYRVVKPSEQHLAAQNAAARGFGVIETLMPPAGQTGQIIVDGDRLTLEIKSPQGSEIVIYDLRKGHEAGRIRLKSR